MDRPTCVSKRYIGNRLERQDLLKSSRIPASAALPLSTVKGASYIPQRSFRPIFLFSEKLKSSRSILSSEANYYSAVSCFKAFEPHSFNWGSCQTTAAKLLPFTAGERHLFVIFQQAIVSKRKDVRIFKVRYILFSPLYPPDFTPYFGRWDIWFGSRGATRGNSRGKFQVFVSPRKGCCEGRLSWRRTKTRNFLFGLQASCSKQFGGRGRGDICYELGWSECRGRQGQTLKCINAIHTSHVPAQLD